MTPRSEAILSIQGVSKVFQRGRSLADLIARRTRSVKALDNVSLDVWRGETLSIVGETGSGKSTLARIALGLLRPSDGSVTFNGSLMDARRKRDLARMRREVAFVAQDPFDSLNPRHTVRDIVGLPLRVQKGRLKGSLDVEGALSSVGLEPRHFLNRYPHELSGGQRQRVAIARALTTRPSLLIGDEPVSALDISVRGQILNLLEELKGSFSLSYLIISHDLTVIRHMSDRVIVLYLGRIAEVQSVRNLFESPYHPYTRALLAAAPALPRDRAPVPPAVAQHVTVMPPDTGCNFAPRCAFVQAVCWSRVPALRQVDDGAVVACHFAEQIAGRGSTNKSPEPITTTPAAVAAPTDTVVPRSRGGAAY